MQENIKEFIEADIKVEACQACADQYGVTDDLAELGIDVKYMGEPLTDYLKSDSKVITF
ncbi:DsrE family protein [Halanaerobium saccharolyticum]|uniref:DsrE family protein n=1 Tax=Halanaerobium saccharolyticum TaxID=43595 RepID=UPI001FB72359|nr:DsrE family protein [Halanaerobium saccharolyticum]